jgi:predicted N-acetyltransferase YhbS
MTVVRAATENDIPRILELYEEQLVIGTSGAEKQRNPAFEDYRRALSMIDALPGCELVVAEEQGEVIGTMMLMIVPNLSHRALPWAVVENVVVDSSNRRKGVGKLLMDYALMRAREAGCYKIQLSSNKSREEAHKFYESIGYKASAEGFRLYL